MDSLLLQTAIKKWYIAYQIAANPMTLNDRQGHSPAGSLAKYDLDVQLYNSWQDFS